MKSQKKSDRVKIAFRFPRHKVCACIGWVHPDTLRYMRVIDIQKFVRFG